MLPGNWEFVAVVPAVKIGVCIIILSFALM